MVKVNDIVWNIISNPHLVSLYILWCPYFFIIYMKVISIPTAMKISLCDDGLCYVGCYCYSFSLDDWLDAMKWRRWAWTSSSTATGVFNEQKSCFTTIMLAHTTTSLYYYHHYCHYGNDDDDDVRSLIWAHV